MKVYVILNVDRSPIAVASTTSVVFDFLLLRRLITLNTEIFDENSPNGFISLGKYYGVDNEWELFQHLWTDDNIFDRLNQAENKLNFYICECDLIR